ncbi:hypothetical protein EJ73_01226 [Hoylesella shahii DSM 15611 = JCM 12083]|uniref:Uncharacterized protein n=1 Tax=Hoylesella shahii DSM 15611 = JCM 12083 TaxID=1122991 RepID=A0A318HV92_9BACT|nr:hypothetical protein EJ73_01226 [Hoylesella shahii DSM 15611 = JCM 12083]
MGAKRMNLPCNMHEFTPLNARDSTAICCILQSKMLELAMYLAPNCMIIRQKNGSFTFYFDLFNNNISFTNFYSFLIVFLCKDNAKTWLPRGILALKRNKYLCINTLQTLRIRRYLGTYLGVVTKRGCFFVKIMTFIFTK